MKFSLTDKLLLKCMFYFKIYAAKLKFKHTHCKQHRLISKFCSKQQKKILKEIQMKNCIILIRKKVYLIRHQKMTTTKNYNKNRNLQKIINVPSIFKTTLYASFCIKDFHKFFTSINHKSRQARGVNLK